MQNKKSEGCPRTLPIKATQTCFAKKARDLKDRKIENFRNN